jgi:hydroxyacylglutathione hydrolase
MGHIAYYFFENSCAFVGDTLFMLGCGRLFEGTPQQMWSSLKKIANLPPETLIYCAHEYTEANARFAVTVDPGNQNLADRIEDIKTLRSEDKPTVPASIAVELATNPFLRAGDPAIQNHLGMLGADIVDVFAEIRKLKDSF